MKPKNIIFCMYLFWVQSLLQPLKKNEIIEDFEDEREYLKLNKIKNCLKVRVMWLKVENNLSHWVVTNNKTWIKLKMIRNK